MSNIQELEQAISQLSPEDLSVFRAWFIEFDAHLWDTQIASDVALGRLDNIADEALMDLSQGRFTDL